MNRRVFLHAIVASMVVLGFGAQAARAGSQIPLPTTLDMLTGVNSGNFVEVTNGGTTLEFSNFSFTQTPPPAPPTAAGVGVAGVTGPPQVPTGETGLEFSSSFNAAAGVTNDWVLSYQVTVLKGPKITDAFLGITGGTNGGTGAINVSETIKSSSFAQLAHLEAFTPGTFSATATFAPQSVLFVTKDINVAGGSLGSTLSVIDQAYSTASTPEPASIALLGIGMTGFLAFRRFFKKSSVA